ncbi:MAG: polyprenyl synthetase family protein, partial [Candidatus Bathyarchaeota archaeon]|nr:polyprenyl synthetase family protein [Candidatus Bathyarchaeota archaeon]
MSRIWRDPLVPTLVVLSCEAVGGEPIEEAYQASTAISLLNLSFRLWDDVIDRSKYMGFIPTVPGKFGDEISLIVGGVVSAKAFSILAEMEIDRGKRRVLNRLVWNYCRTMGKAETLNLELRKRRDVRPEEKLKVFEMEAMNLATSMKIGSILGEGSKNEIEHLGKYGWCL